MRVYIAASLHLPAFFLAHSLFLPILPLHSPSTRGTTNRNGVWSSTVTTTSLPNAKLSKFISGVVPGHKPTYTCLPNSICMESTATEVTVAEGLPEEANAITDSRKKRQRQKHAHNWQPFTRAQFPGGRFPAKFRYQPIKLHLHPLSTRIPRIICACTSGLSGYIKRVQ